MDLVQHGSADVRVASALASLTELFAELRSGVPPLSDNAVSERVGQLQQVVNVASAVQAVWMALYAARGDVRGEDGTWTVVEHPIGHIDEFAGDAFGPVLGLSPVAAAAKVARCAAWVSRLPLTLAAMGSGDLDPWRASVIADELVGASPAVCAQVEEWVLPEAISASPGQVRRAVRRALALVDPDAVKARGVRALADRFVRVWPGEAPGVSTWSAVLPTETSVSCWAAVNEVAHRARADGDVRSIDQARADALGDLILGNVTVTTTAHLMIPVDPVHRSAAQALDDCRVEPGPKSQTSTRSSTGPSFGACEVPGVGIISAQAVDEICARFSTRITRVLLEPSTGVILETGAMTYRPPDPIRRFVELRDGTCRFPGCARAARRCDVDHVTAWPNGQTEVTNLVSLCRHHHRAKHEAGWTLSMTATGVCTWRSRHDQIFTTHPTNHGTNRSPDPPHRRSDDGRDGPEQPRDPVVRVTG